MKKNIWFGLTFIMLSVLVILRALGYGFGISWFSLIVAILMISVSFKGFVQFDFVQGLVPLAIVGIIFDKQLNITELTPIPLLAASFLLGIGLSMIIKKRRPYRFKFNYDRSNHYSDHHDYTSNYQGSLADDSSSQYISTKFSDSTKYLYSSNLKDAYLSVTFGELTVYFDSVTLDSDGAHINVDCIFGEMKLFINRDWNIVFDIQSSIGGNVNENQRKSGGHGPTLYIHGNVKFGNIEIFYV